MLLIIEIMLTVSVWRCGWKGWALLPTGLAMGFLIVVGPAIDPALASGSGFSVGALLADGLIIATLLIMRANPPQKNGVADRIAEPVSGQRTLEV